MAVTVVGVFDSAREVQLVHDDLVRAGVAAESIEAHAQDTDTAHATDAGAGRKHGLFGWLRDIFDDEEGQRYAGSYSEAVRRGSYVVSVIADDSAEADQVATIMEEDGAIDVDERAEQWRTEGWSGYREDAPALSGEEIERERNLRADEKARIPVVKDELEVGKREASRGRVRVASRVVERPVEARVKLREEHVQIERHPVDRPASEADLRAAQGETIEITERAEEPVAAKTAHVVEEVEVGKRASEHEEVVRDTVRETHVDVEEDNSSSDKKKRR